MKVIKFKTAKKIFSFLLLFSFFLLPAISAASSNLWDSQIGTEQVGTEAFGESGDPDDPREVVANIINVALGLLSVIFVTLLIIGGYQYMTAGGNEEQVNKAKARLKTAVIGIIIILVAWGVTWFVLSRIAAITSGKANYMNPPGSP